MNRFLFIVFFLFLLMPLANSADYYWVGGSGDWSDINHWAKSSGSSLKHLQVPTASDNIYFDSNSFTAPGQTVNLNTNTIVCNDLIINNADSMVFQGIAQTIYIYGSLKLQSKMNWLSGIDIRFNSQNTGNTIETAGNKLSNIYFNGTGGEWILQDELVADNITHLKGKLKTNGKNVKAKNLTSSSTNPRTLVFDNSNLYFGSVLIQGAGISVDAGTSELIFNDVWSTFKILGTPNLTFHDVTFELDSGFLHSFSTHTTLHDLEFQVSGKIEGNHTLHNLILFPPEGLRVIEGFTQTIQGEIIPNSSCINYTRIVGDNGIATFMKSSGSIDVEYVDLENTHATGGATFNANNSHDLGNNTGWNFTTPNARTLYWVDGTGSWHDTTHWSLSSGGPSGECPPTAIDNVIIDQNSGSCDTITYGDQYLPSECHDITWNKNNACPMVMIGNDHLKIYGSMDFDNQVNFNSSLVVFKSNDMGETVKTGNIWFDAGVRFNGEGSWSLQDSLKIKIQNPSTPPNFNKIELKKGHLNTNGNYVTAPNFCSPLPTYRTLSLGDSRIDIWKKDSSWVVFQDSLTINPGTSHIYLHDSLAKMINQGGKAVNYHNVTFTHPGEAQVKLTNDANTYYNKVLIKGNAKIKGLGEFDSLLLSQDRIYNFQGDFTQTINDYLGADGGCLGWITMKSALISDTAIISSPSGTISVNNVLMKQVRAEGGATFYANNSADEGGNPGWIFTSPTGQDHYWVGGPGKWSDTTHWSYSSGGPGGACLPTPFDDVYFDSQSFNSNNETVQVDCFNAYCHDMDWSGANYNPIIQGDTNKHLRIFGSLNLIDSSMMSWDYAGYTHFSATDTGHSIHSRKNIIQQVTFDGVFGEWKLMDTLRIEDKTKHFVGTLDLNELALHTSSFRSDYARNKTLDISSAYLEVEKQYSMRCDSLTLHAAHSLLEASNVAGVVFNYGQGNYNYWNVLFSGTNVQKSIDGQLITHNANLWFNKVKFMNNANVMGAHTMDTLELSGGREHVFESMKTQTIVDKWISHTDCNNYSLIRSDSAGVQTNFVKINGDVALNYVKLKDVNGIGSVNYDAYESYDKGNNTGWTIHPKTPLQLYWVNGEGEWGDPYHWSFSSGGSGGACIPTRIDDVHFDAHSFSAPGDTVGDSCVVHIECHDMTWSGAQFKPTFDMGFIDIHGSLNLIDSMYTNLGAFYFLSDTLGETIATAGHPIGTAFFENGGGWKLLDSFPVASEIYFFKGSLNTNGQFVSCNTFDSRYDSVRTLTLDTSDIHVGEQWLANGSKLTLDGGQSHIHLIDTSTTKPLTMKLFNGGKQDYHNVSIFQPAVQSYLKQDKAQGIFNKLSLESDMMILGTSKSDTLILRPGYTYKLDHTSPQRIYDHWQVRGNNCFSINLESTLIDHQAIVRKNGTDVLGDFINMQDIKAMGNATFYAGDFSDDISNNDNWIFTNGPNYVYGLKDTTYFQLGGSVTLSGNNFNGTPSTHYEWSTGSTADSVVVDSTAWYYVTVTYAGGCVVEDSTYLACELDLDFHTKQTTCHGGDDGFAQVIIPDSSAYYTYHWETGDSSNSIKDQPAGWYNVMVVANDLCGAHDSVKISQPPPVQVPLNDTAYCEGDSLKLDAGNKFKDYQWGDGWQKQYRYVLSPDTFYLAVKDSKGCWSDVDTIVVSEDSIPKLDLGPDSTLCLHETRTIKALKGCDDYLWNTGSHMPEILVTDVGHYWVKVRRGACTASDTLILNHCDPKFEIPNVFTPNGDGYNDRFIPRAENITDFEMIIFNRWGNEVYRTRDMLSGWDGKINGRDAAEGIYYFVITYRNYGGSKHRKKESVSGDVTLLRE